MPLMTRQGDTTSRGAAVLEGFPFYTVEDRSVATMGHQVACPLRNGVPYTIKLLVKKTVQAELIVHSMP